LMMVLSGTVLLARRERIDRRALVASEKPILTILDVMFEMNFGDW